MTSDESSASADDDYELPSVEHLLSQIDQEDDEQEDDYELGYDSSFSRRSINTQGQYDRLKALRDHYKHKGYWSLFIMIIMFVMVVFQCVLLGMVGGHSWKFTDYKWLLPALLVQNLAQIVGLAVIVVKSLFKEIK